MKRLIGYCAIGIGSIVLLLSVTLLIPFFDHTERFAATDPREWDAGLAVSLEFPVPDTIREYELSVIMRCRNKFSLEELTLGIEVMAADSVAFHDSLVVESPVSDIARQSHFEMIVPYRKNVRFFSEAPYIFTFTPSVAVKGVTGIGVVANPM